MPYSSRAVPRRAWHVARMVLYVAGAVCIGWLLLAAVFQPSHDRVWELGQEQLPHVVFAEESDLVTIENYRDFDWTTATSATVRYSTKVVDLAQIEGVDVFISHFDDFEGLAHIFLSFGFADGEQVVVSLETRREEGEEFSPLLGILRQFEIIYVVGSERDIAGVRTGHRGERVYLYPTKAGSAEARELFLLVMGDVNAVYERPRMYNTLTHNCTNELTRRVEDMSDIEFPLTWKAILPGYFDEVLYEVGVIATDEPFVDTKARHLIDNAAVETSSDTYSADLRAQIAR